jgi:hypothetical protein
MNNKKEGADEKDRIKAAKARLAEMVNETKKRILLGNLTVPSPFIQEAHD